MRRNFLEKIGEIAKNLWKNCEKSVERENHELRKPLWDKGKRGVKNFLKKIKKSVDNVEGMSYYD